MSKSIRCFLLLALFHYPLICASSQLTNHKLSLILAANMPEISNTEFGSYSQLATLLEQVRQQNDNSLFLFGGGSLGPSALSSLDRGSHIIDILNTLEPDLMTLEKREFSYSADQLTLRSFEAAFPIVGSNVYDPLTKSNLEGIATHLVIEKAGLRIGFISILDDDTASEYNLKRVRITSPEKVITEQISALKEQNVDMIILLFSKEQPIYKDLLRTQQIDIILSTSRKPQQKISADLLNMKHFYALTENQPCLMLNIGWLSSLPDSIEVNRLDIDLTHLKKNISTELQLNQYTDRLNRLLNQSIGQLKNEMDTRKTLIRTNENAFGNFIADALRAGMRADIAIINSGSIRGNQQYPAGTVLTRADIVRELPFRHLSTLIEVSGTQLLAALENGVSMVEDIEGRFPQVSGIRFSYSPTSPVGQRINSVFIQGTSLDLIKTYKLAVTTYLAKGNDGYVSLAEAYNQQLPSENPILLADIVANAMIRQPIIELKTNNRITKVVE